MIKYILNHKQLINRNLGKFFYGPSTIIRQTEQLYLL